MQHCWRGSLLATTQVAKISFPLFFEEVLSLCCIVIEKGIYQIYQSVMVFLLFLFDHLQ